MDLFAWLRGGGWGGGHGEKESYLSLFPSRPLPTSRAVAKVVSLCGLHGIVRGQSDKKNPVSSLRALDQERHKVLEIDSKGNLYLYRSALLCKNEIIKRLTEDKFKLVEPSTIGKVQSFTSYNQNSGVTSLAPLPNLRTTDALNASAVRRLPTPQLSTKYTYNSHRQAARKKNKCPSVYERLVLGDRL